MPGVEMVVTLSHDSKAWIRQQIQEIVRAHVDKIEAEPEPQPITIEAPDGERSLFVDGDGESHWVLPRYMAGARKHGWRQCFTVAGR